MEETYNTGVRWIRCSASSCRRGNDDGYNSVSDDEGANVSIGYKQPLTLARAFLARPSVLILEECTFSVDTRTEAFVQTAHECPAVRLDILGSCEPLSAICDADIIAVMEAAHSWSEASA